MEEQDPISIIHSIFINFFGEENVDLQGQTIIVHFPKVTVTNENDRSVDITHLWAKVELSRDGTINGSFQLLRSELTSEQFFCGYSHSHISYRDTTNFDRWANPCLGQGPIRGTIASLSREFSEDMWNLFCLELSKYVTVESLAGTPYMYLERIGQNNRSVQKVKFPFRPIYLETNYFVGDEANQTITEFIPYILQKRPFGFNYNNSSYSIAMSDRDLFITLSNLFIEYYNSLPGNTKVPSSSLYETGVIAKGKIIGNELYYIRDYSSSSSEHGNIVGRSLFRFKDKTITFNIVDDTQSENNRNISIFLTEAVVNVIIDRILRTINNKYGHSDTEESDFSRETHRYL